MRFILLPFIAAMTMWITPFVAESKPRPTGLTADEAKSHTQDHCDDRIEWVREVLERGERRSGVCHCHGGFFIRREVDD